MNSLNVHNFPIFQLILMILVLKSMVHRALFDETYLSLGLQSNNEQRLRQACAYAQSEQNLCKWLEYSMNIKLLTEQHLEFLSLKGGCTCSSESIHVKMPHCLKSHVAAHFYIGPVKLSFLSVKLLFFPYHVFRVLKRTVSIRRFF